MKPWVDGPKELLQHGLIHLSNDTDFDNRMAMISIDNSVELMIRTYLGLPKRFTGIKGLSRKELEDASNSFPLLLDLLEKHVNDKISDIDLADLEWFHRVRNQLYHAGNGITVEGSKVNIYAEIAKTLFKNLFGFTIEVQQENPRQDSVGEFLNIWNEITIQLRHLIRENDGGERDFSAGPIYYRKLEMLGSDPKMVEYYQYLTLFRSELLHSSSELNQTAVIDNINKAKELLDFIKLIRKNRHLA